MTAYEHVTFNTHSDSELAKQLNKYGEDGYHVVGFARERGHVFVVMEREKVSR